MRHVHSILLCTTISLASTGSSGAQQSLHLVPAANVRAIVPIRGATRVFAGTISGRVTDSSTGQPVVAAQVSVVGATRGQATDARGQYTISGVAAGAREIEVRRVGFVRATRNVTVQDGATTTLDFVLVAVPTTLAEVITTVTGEQTRGSVGNAISTVRTDSVIKEAIVLNVSDMLATRVPGAVINNQDGYTGTVSPIRLRGLNSFTMPNNPIVIVDGARIESSPSADLNTTGQLRLGGNNLGSSRLADLNLNEVESVDVVKGPAAATLYGTDAANGVIIIKTKKGQVGRLRWDGYGSYGTSKLVTTDFIDNYFPWGHTAAGVVGRCQLVAVAAATCTQDSTTHFNPLKFGPTSPLTTGHLSTVGVQASGGVGQFNYLLSGSHEGELGWLKMPPLERERILAAQGLTSLPDWQTRPNSNYKNNIRANVATTLGTKGDISLSNGLVMRDFRTPSTAPMRGAYAGLGWNDPVTHGYGSGIQAGDYFQVQVSDAVTRYLSSLSASYRPVDWLVTRATVGLDWSNDFIDNLQMTGQGPPGVSRTGTRTLGNNNIAQYTFDGGLTATKNLVPSLTSKTSIGAQYNRREQVYGAQTGTGLPPGSQTITGAAALTVTELHNDAVVVGTYVEEQIAWRDRLFASAAVRVDGASTFGRDLNSAVYPKLSLSWLASEESNLPKIPGVSSLRFRVAYGSSGVQPPSTAAISTVSLVTASINGVATSGVVPGTFGNPLVGPERQTELEAGFDLEALGGRFRTEFTGYNRKSTDALVSVPIESSAGGGSTFQNVGSVGNRGFEGSASLRVLDRQAIAFDLMMTGSLNNNELLKVNSNAPPGFFVNNGFLATRHRLGYPLYGLWQRPILSYADANNDGILIPAEIVVGDTDVYLGPSAPTRQMATSGTLSLLKGMIRIGAQLDWRGGYQRLDAVEYSNCIAFTCPGTATRGEATFPEQAAAQAVSKAASNYGFIADGAFTRLREVSATVSIPGRLLRGVKASGGSLALSGRNLKLWTKWPGADPEVNFLTGGDLPYSASTPPAARYFVVRLNLSY